MATYTHNAPIGQLGRGGGTPRPPKGGGDDGGSRDSGLPNYGARLRRARLGMICAIATVGMVFVSLTSALIVRRGLAPFDEGSRSFVRDWGGGQVSAEVLGGKTLTFLVRSVTVRGVPRQVGWGGAAGSV